MYIAVRFSKPRISFNHKRQETNVAYKVNNIIASINDKMWNFICFQMWEKLTNSHLPTLIMASKTGKQLEVTALNQPPGQGFQEAQKYQTVPSPPTILAEDSLVALNT